jgi:zinc transporter ZupT
MFEATYGTVLLVSLTACAVTTLGIWIISRHEEWGRAKIRYFVAFAAGVLLTVSFLHLVTKSLEMTPSAPYYLLGGYWTIFLSNYFLRSHTSHEEADACLPAGRTMGIITIVGIGFHSLVDGAIHAVTFNISVFTGLLAAVGMVFHEFPEGIVSFVLLSGGGLSKKKAAIIAFLAAALSTPIGALIAYPLVDRVAPERLGGLLAAAAGVLIYVGGSHLIPRAETHKEPGVLLALAGGIATALLFILTRQH